MLNKIESSFNYKYMYKKKYSNLFYLLYFINKVKTM